MMPDFARSLFGFGKSSNQSGGAAQASKDISDESNVPTATNSRAPSTSHIRGNDENAMMTTRNNQEVAATGQVSTDIRGKVKIRIIEARGLNTDSSSMPYVVCTLDSSEFITRGQSNQPTEHNYGIAIPNSRQSSSLALSQLGKQQQQQQQAKNPSNSHNQNSQNQSSTQQPSSSNPQWKDEAQFDVTSDNPVLSISIYDSNNDEAFLGHVQFPPTLDDKQIIDKWFKLEARAPGEHVSGDVRVHVSYEKTSKKQFGPQDFEVLRMVGKGTFGQVYQVRKKDTQRIYAMKVLSKRAIVQKKEIAHTIGERNILVRTTSTESAFIVGLKFSFQTPQDLYLVTDYMSGGELFYHLQHEGRFKEPRAKFYIAELILALESLHEHDIVYRDLKPENVLLDATGHVALCDFGLSKASPADGRTNTFCGTTEYLAPEVLLDDQGYTKMVDFWSLGVLVFEMCCGWSPFYAEDNQQMYKNIAFGKVRFPKDALSTEGRNFVKGLLNRNPKHRMGATDDTRELRRHPFFDDVDWDALKAKKIPPPFKPHITSETDTSNFDPEFTNTSASVLNRQFMTSSTPLSPGIQANFRGFTYVNDSTLEEAYGGAGSGSSYRPRVRTRGKGGRDNDIDLYDDQEIQESYRMNGSELVRHLQKYKDSADMDMDRASDEEGHRQDDDGDIEMGDDDDDDVHDFTGQKFEL